MNFNIIISILILCILFGNFIFNYYHYKKQETLKRLKLLKVKIEQFQKIKQEQERINNIDKFSAQKNPPEYIKLHNLLRDFKQTHSWDNIVAVGDIYKSGAYPRFKNNKDLALECYKIAAQCPDGEIAGIAQLKYIETSRNNINEKDNAGDDLPCYFGIEICNLALNFIKNTPHYYFNRPKTKSVDINQDDFVVTPILHQIPATITLPLNHHVYRNDTQNVHDHSVSNILKSNIQKLNKKVSRKENHENDISSIIDSILSHPELSDSVKANCLTVIDNLNSTDKHETYNLSEKEALIMVWNKINDNIKKSDKYNKNDSIQILANQLDSSIEHGNIVCSTGKIARIIGTLDGIDDDITPSKPLWVIRDEISNLAAKIRDNNYSNPRKEFEESVKNIYIKELNMNDSIINPIIDEYAQHL